jgi:hypothetical protein
MTRVRYQKKGGFLSVPGERLPSSGLFFKNRLAGKPIPVKV